MPTTKAPRKAAPAPSDADRVYDCAEVAALTHLTEAGVRKMFQDGRIPTIKMGRRRVVTAAAMRRILTEGV